jgi:hypothetical protein
MPGNAAKGPLFARLPIVEYEPGQELDLDDYVVHEYHLLRILNEALHTNFARPLRRLACPR